MTKVDTILATVSMADLLEKYGIAVVNGRCKCPFHDDNRPSAVINRDGKTFHCYPCNATFNVISFVMRYHNCDASLAIAKINDLFQLGLDRHLTTVDKYEMLLSVRERREQLTNKIFKKLLVNSAFKKVSRQLQKLESPQQLLMGKIKRGEATDSDIDQWFANEPTVAWLEWLWNRLMEYEQDRSPFDFDLWKVADLSTTDLATAILQDKLPLNLSHYKPLRATKQVS